MNQDLKDNVCNLVAYLLEKAADDPKLRSMLQETASSLQAGLPKAPEPRSDSPETPPAPTPPPKNNRPQPAPPAPVLRPEQLRWAIQEEVTQPAAEFDDYDMDKHINDAELELIEDRCRMKAKGARWAAERGQLLEDDAVDFKQAIEPKDREIIEQAKELPDCFLWMNHNSGPAPSNLTLWQDVAGCFDALAAVASLTRDALEVVEQCPNIFESTLDLGAEAQSALRSAIERVDVEHAISDKDQVKYFQWLRGTAASHKIFIERFMRVDDKANPADWPSLHERVDQLAQELETLRKREKIHRNLLGRVRYHINKIEKSPQDDHDDDWEKIVGAIDQLIKEGFPPSNNDLREVVLPIIEEIPDKHVENANLRLVLREIDRFLAARPVSGEAPLDDTNTQEIEEVCTLLEGKQVVLIGGSRRQQAKESLEKSFRLDELNWLETTEHQPIGLFEPHIGRPEVALVLLAIRWSSHSFGEVRRFCEDYGKPLVRLPGGYNPNQVAAQILAQASRQLEESEAS